MSRCEFSLCRILGAVTALALVLPPLALGDLGVCPPYSKAFGPGDPDEEILAFIDEINSRPGGGTLVLGRGEYFRGTAPRTIRITGIVCITASEPEWGADLIAALEVAPGGRLTSQSLYIEAFPPDGGFGVEVEPGATFYGENTFIVGIETLRNQGLAFVDDCHIQAVSSPSSVIANTGTLVMRGSEVTGHSNVGLQNDGYALLERTSVTGLQGVDSMSAILNGPGGALTLVDSIVAGNVAMVRSISTADPVATVGILNSPGSFATIVSSTVGRHEEIETDPYPGEVRVGIGIRNEGSLELGRSIVWPSACGAVTDLGYNVGNCPTTHSTSQLADPQFQPGSIELGTGSPAIDLIPVELCSPTDALSRARTDGNNDGAVACDAGALEYGYASVEVVVRTMPYWRTVGRIDLSSESLLFISVMSGGPIDPTTILFDSIVVGDFPRSAIRGAVYYDKNGDSLPDYNFWYRLDRALVLDCRYYDEPFTATTDNGLQVTGRLQFEAVGCTP